MRRWLFHHRAELAFLASAVLALLVVINAARSYWVLQEASTLEQHAELAQLSAALIHELQKERGMSAGFLGSAGTRYLQELAEQRQQTDSRLEALSHYSSVHRFNSDTQALLTQLNKRLQQLPAKRLQVDRLNITLDDMLAYYTAHNRLLLDSLAMLIKVSATSDVAQKVVTLSNFARAKEQAGIERAVLNNVFSADQFTPQLKHKHAQLVATQQAFLHNAIVTATVELHKTLTVFLNSNEQRQVEYYRHVAASKDANYNTKAEDWFQAATARIDLYRSTEAKVIDELQWRADQLQSIHMGLFCLNLALLLAALAWIWQENGAGSLAKGKH